MHLHVVTGVVPKAWLTDDKTHTFWPNERNPHKLCQLASKEVSPNEKTWQKYKIDRTFGTAGM